MNDNSISESELVTHARRELASIGETAEMTEKYVAVVKAFEDMELDGGGVQIGIAVIGGILNFQNLGPLTDNPDEWHQHEENLHQNRRNGEAFSTDGGRTYTLLSERSHGLNNAPTRFTRHHRPCSKCGATEQHRHHYTCPMSLNMQTGI